jgi:hypothetical protein
MRDLLPAALIARSFAHALLCTVGREQYDTIVRLNAEHRDSPFCHSGDFCDANMVMDAAFRQNGIEIPFSDDDADLHAACTDLWNAAWDLWKADPIGFLAL